MVVRRGAGSPGCCGSRGLTLWGRPSRRVVGCCFVVRSPAVRCDRPGVDRAGGGNPVGFAYAADRTWRNRWGDAGGGGWRVSGIVPKSIGRPLSARCCSRRWARCDDRDRLRPVDSFHAVWTASLARIPWRHRRCRSDLRDRILGACRKDGGHPDSRRRGSGGVPDGDPDISAATERRDTARGVRMDSRSSVDGGVDGESGWFFRMSSCRRS